MAKNLLADPQAEMRPTPRRNLLAGWAADALNSLNAYAQRQDPTMPGGMANPPLAYAADLMSLPAIGRTLDRVSYGEPLTTGKGMTTQLRPDTVETAMAVAPVAAKFPRAVGGAALGLAGAADTGASKAAVYVGKQKIADNAYHGSGQKFDRFDLERLGTGHADVGEAVWLADDYGHAAGYAQSIGRRMIPKERGSVMEANVYLKNPMRVDAMQEANQIAEELGIPVPDSWDEAAELLQYKNWVADKIEMAKAAGHDSLIVANTGDAPHTQNGLANHFAVFNPNRARIKK